MQLVQRVQMECLSQHLFFASLSYSSEALPKLTTSSGFDIAYADVHDVQCMMKRLRKADAFGRPFRYFAVSELGSKRGRPHVHILFLVQKHAGDDVYDCLNLQKLMFDTVLAEWRRNVGSTRSPVWVPLCRYVRRYVRGRLSTNYDLHCCTSRRPSDSMADVAFYVLKYMLKPSSREVRLQRALRLNLPPEEYDDTWSVVRPRWFSSLHFGLPRTPDGSIRPEVLSYLRGCVERSISERLPYPCYWSPETGDQFPLSRYYRSVGQVFSYKDALSFYFDKNDERVDTVYESLSDLELAQVKKNFHKYEKILSAADLDRFLPDGLD